MKETIEIEKQLAQWQSRVEFLKQYQDEISKQAETFSKKRDGKVMATELKYFELMDKFYACQIEIDSKNNVIEKRKQDKQLMEEKLKAIEKEVNDNMDGLVTRLKLMELRREHQYMARGIIFRHGVKQGLQEKAQDYQAAKNILAFYK